MYVGIYRDVLTFVLTTRQSFSAKGVDEGQKDRLNPEPFVGEIPTKRTPGMCQLFAKGDTRPGADNAWNLASCGAARQRQTMPFSQRKMTVKTVTLSAAEAHEIAQALRSRIDHLNEALDLCAGHGVSERTLANIADEARDASSALESIEKQAF